MLDARDADKAEAFMVKRGIKVIKGNGISEVKQNSIRLADGTKCDSNVLTILDSWG